MNAVLYARFSPRRNAAETETIQCQTDRCRAYCTAMDYAVVGEYSDEAKSGKDRNRDGLTAAIACAIENKAVLVVRDLSRLTRDVRDALDIRDELMDGGAGLVDLETRLDTASPMGECMMTVKGAFDKLMRITSAIKTSETLLWKQKNGQSISRHIPFGFKRGRREKLPSGRVRTFLDKCDREQGIIRRVVELRDAGVSQIEIVRQMNREKVSIRGHKWHVSTVQRILAGADNGKVNV